MTYLFARTDEQQQHLDNIAADTERLQVQQDRFGDGTTDEELRLAYARSRTDGITIDAALMLGRKGANG